jgi:hypothetical protein
MVARDLLAAPEDVGNARVAVDRRKLVGTTSASCPVCRSRTIAVRYSGGRAPITPTKASRHSTFPIFVFVGIVLSP